MVAEMDEMMVGMMGGSRDGEMAEMMEVKMVDEWVDEMVR